MERLNALLYDRTFAALARLPDGLEVSAQDGEGVPAWWLSMELLSGIIHPNELADYADVSIMLVQRINELKSHIDSLSSGQLGYLRSMAARNDFLKILRLAIAHSARWKTELIDFKLRQIELQLGIGSGCDGSELTVLAVIKDGDSPFRYSIKNSLNPSGIWVDQDKSTEGIAPKSVNFAGKRTVVAYMQTNWDLPIGPRIDAGQIKLNTMLDQLKTGGLDEVLPRVKPNATLGDFLAEAGRARAAYGAMASEFVNQAPTEDGVASVLENPYLEDVLSGHIIDMLLSAESLRKKILEKKSSGIKP